jgi:hypothetical protein
LFGPWSTVAINFSWGKMKAHKDKSDYINRLCWLVTIIGDYDGGELHFPELDITI